MISRRGLKDWIVKLNNFLLSLPLFYIGIGLSFLMWKLNCLVNGKSEGGWKNIEENLDNLEKMERMW